MNVLLRQRQRRQRMLESPPMRSHASPRCKISWSRRQPTLHAVKLKPRHLGHQCTKLEKQRAEAERKIATLDSQTRQQQARIAELEVDLHHWWQQTQLVESERDALRSSWSWRITRPMRLMAGLAKERMPISSNRDQDGADRPPSIVQRPLAGAMRLVLQDPTLAYRINQHVPQYPAAHRRLLAVARRHGLMPPSPVAISETISNDGDSVTIPKLDPRVFPTGPTLPEAYLFPPRLGIELPWIRFVGHVEGHYSLAIVNRGLAGALEQLAPGRLEFIPYHGKPYGSLPKLPDAQGRLLGFSPATCLRRPQAEQFPSSTTTP